MASFNSQLRYLTIAAATLTATLALAQKADTTFVRLTDGSIQAFPAALVKQRTQSSTQLIFTDIDNGRHLIRRADIVSESNEGPKDNPWLTVFKFNNKYNSSLFQDVILDPTAGTTLAASVPAIGKWLTPSFQCSDDNAKVYVGSVEQRSKRTRQLFTSDKVYTVARPGRTVLRRTVDGEEAAPQPQPETRELIAITEADLSTNAPSNNPNTEGLGKMLDDDYTTFFHSTWGDNGPNEKLPLDVAPWIEAVLPQSVRYLQFFYCTRMDTNGRSPLAWDIQVSTDGVAWTTVKQLSQTTDNLPAQGEYTSPTIDLGGNYKFLRLVMTEANYKNYLCIAELRLYKVTPSSGGGASQPTGSGHCDMVPLGLDYTISIDFPTDRASNVPRIDLVLEDGYDNIYSKYYYIDATFSIDGQGVFPNLEATPVQVKGRGNSSWDGNFYWGSPKNPYRLKFYESQKPFGLAKGKSWVLLANKISGSMTTNAIGMKAAGIVGTVAYNHIVPVELYINGEYRGSYNFTEKLGFHNNSIELADETRAALIELDTYAADEEETLFTTSRYSLPAKVKYPNFIDDETVLTIDDIKNSFNDMLVEVAQHKDVSGCVDVDALAAFYMVNDLILNLEIMHPKSTYVYNPNIGDPGSRWTWGPVWDLDWAFGHELAQNTYFATGQTSSFLSAKSMEKNAFWQALRKCGEPLDRAIYYIWHRFMEEGGLDELLDYCDEYYAYARPSLEHNASMWWDGDNYATVTANAKRWLEQRAQYIYSRLTPYDISNGIDEMATDDEATMSPAWNNAGDDASFDVYDMRGVCMRRGVSSRNWRNGLPRGLYIVRGRKVLVD